MNELHSRLIDILTSLHGKTSDSDLSERLSKQYDKSLVDDAVKTALHDQIVWDYKGTIYLSAMFNKETEYEQILAEEQWYASRVKIAKNKKLGGVVLWSVLVLGLVVASFAPILPEGVPGIGEGKKMGYIFIFYCMNKLYKTIKIDTKNPGLK